MTKPKTWRAWIPEPPGPSVTAVRDIDGDLWQRVGDQWLHVNSRGEKLHLDWHLLFEWGPLTEETETK